MAMLYIGSSSSGPWTEVLDPSAMEFGISDISASDAGRDESLRMWKAKKGQKQQISMTWNGTTPEQTATLLTQFDAEYFYLKYTDPKTNAEAIRQFYASDRKAPLQQWFIGGKLYKQVSVEAIER